MTNCRLWLGLFAIHVAVSGCNSSSDLQKLPASPGEPADGLSIQDGLPGRKGEPPPEIRTFVAPITLIAAGEYMDGGTTWVRLKDSRGTQVVLCVTQDLFESEIKGNTLFMGGTHADQTSARRPLTDTEADLMIASLEAAVEPLLDERLTARIKTMGDPAEAQTVEELTGPEKSRLAQEDWHIIYAHHALVRLKSVTKHDLADPAELEDRIARLGSVDLDSAAAEFRAKTGRTRHDEWDQLQPVLLAELEAVAPSDPRSFLTKWLGPSDVAAAERSGSMAGGLFEAPAADRVLAYNLETDGSFFRDLVFHLREDGSVSFGVVAVAEPTPTETSHDRISKAEQEVAKRLGAISINLGGGSLDGSFKPGFSLGLQGSEVTHENVRLAATLTTLVSLHLEGPGVTDECLAILSGHDYLAGLDLVTTNVTDEGLRHLETLPTLRFLEIKGGKITRAGIDRFEKVATQCEVDWESQ